MLQRFSIKSSLVFTFATLLLAMLAAGIYAASAISAIKREFTHVVDENVNLLSTISDLRYYTVTYRRFALDYGLTTSAAEHAKIIQVIEANRAEVEASLQRMLQLAQSPDVVSFVNEYRSRIEAYRHMQENYIRLIDQGQIETARATILGEMLAPFNRIVDLLSEIQEQIVAEAHMIRDSQTQAIEQVLYSVALSFVAIAVFAAGMGLTIGRKVGRPLAILTAQMQRVEEGELGAELDRTQFADDELGVCAAQFSRMQQALRDLVLQISDSAAQLENSVRDVRQLAEQASQSTQEQNTELADMAVAMEQMQRSFEEVSRSTNGAASAAREAAAEAAKGNSTVGATIAQIEEVARQIEAAAAVVQSLRDESANIGVVSEVIGEIAEQTNLLALNAAIEAARAGSQGRGFAVVAGEVRNLAQRTQASIAQIGSTIEVLQARSVEAEQAMQHSRTAMAASVDQARQAGLSIGQISQAVAQISDMNGRIATATEQQTVVAAELSQGADRVHRTAAAVASGAEETARACSQLSELATTLNGLTQRFRI